MATQKPHTPVIIIGAGFSGLITACQLQRKLNLTDYTIYERSNDYGGTWSANTYPGCGVDIPAILYSISFLPNPSFSQLFPERAEILSYIRSVAKKFDLERHVRLNTGWEGATWQEDSKRWLVRLRDVKTGEKFEQECSVLLSCVGGLVNPQPCALNGVEDFKGRILHTAKWDEGVEWKGEDVVVVGNGCSAAQLIPALAPDAKHITQFMRTPQHHFPRPNAKIPQFLQVMFLYIPFLLRLCRFVMFLIVESEYPAFALSKKGLKAREAVSKESQHYVQSKAPEEYWPLLTPSYMVGCKRRIYDPGYLETLSRPNVYLTDDPITQALPHSVLTKSGKEYPADLIVLATGFTFTQLDIPIHGRNHITPQEHWSQYGGMEAYQTTALSDFPNFFFVVGPNISPGHTSLLINIENVVNLITRIIKPIIKKYALAVNVKPEAEKAFSHRIQKALSERVWKDNCNSYYVDKNNWNFANYPWSSFTMWKETRFPVIGDWVYEGTETAKAR